MIKKIHFQLKLSQRFGSLPDFQWDGKGQALQDSLFKEQLTALDHQVKAY